ncbi:predicted protein [Botrytis cinerea T4]|uniref:Uncharacterized protein n=1 Tax=Botryotinia fuckeliana (strain T4) TaxID=999810 RepID=G2YTV3_BOTF4|nr:predicted protein [Botrytis cinerea T4]
MGLGVIKPKTFPSTLLRITKCEGHKRLRTHSSEYYK